MIKSVFRFVSLNFKSVRTMIMWKIYLEKYTIFSRVIKKLNIFCIIIKLSKARPEFVALHSTLCLARIGLCY